MTPCGTGWCLPVMPTHSRGNWVSTWQAKDMNPHMQTQTFEGAYFIYPNVNLKLKRRTLKAFQTTKGREKVQNAILISLGLMSLIQEYMSVLVSTPSTTIMKFTVVLVSLLSNSIALDCTMKLWIREHHVSALATALLQKMEQGVMRLLFHFSPPPRWYMSGTSDMGVLMLGSQ